MQLTNRSEIYFLQTRIFFREQKFIPDFFFKRKKFIFSEDRKKLSEHASVKSFAQQQKSRSRRRSSKWKAMKITARGTERNTAAREVVHNIIGVCQKIFSEKVQQQMKSSETYSERHSKERSRKRGCPQYYTGGVCQKVFYVRVQKNTFWNLYFVKT